MPDYELQIRTEGVVRDSDGNVIPPEPEATEDNNEDPEEKPE